MVGRRVSRARTPPAARIMHNLRPEPVASELQHRKKRLHLLMFTIACFVSSFWYSRPLALSILGGWCFQGVGVWYWRRPFFVGSLSSATEGTNVGHSRDECFASALRAPHNGQRASMARRGSLAARPYFRSTCEALLVQPRIHIGGRSPPEGTDMRFSVNPKTSMHLTGPAAFQGA